MCVCVMCGVVVKKETDAKSKPRIRGYLSLSVPPVRAFACLTKQPFSSVRIEIPKAKTQKEPSQTEDAEPWETLTHSHSQREVGAFFYAYTISKVIYKPTVNGFTFFFIIILNTKGSLPRYQS